MTAAASATDGPVLLARMADSLYWFARSVERAEDTARIVLAQSEMFFDIPVHLEVGWEPLLAIVGERPPGRDGSGDGTTGADERADESEAAVVHRLLFDEANPSSIVSSVAVARENLRVTRPLVPDNMFETVNRLWLHTTEMSGTTMTRTRRDRWLRQVVTSCQTIAGQLVGTMRRDLTWRFLRLGAYLERADMTTRVLDVRAEALLPRDEDDRAPFDEVLWMSALRSLGALQMYRRAMPAGEQDVATLRFVLQDPQFPRSVAFCLDEIAGYAGGIVGSTPVTDAVQRARAVVSAVDCDALRPADVHELVDRVQVALGDVHDTVDAVWFRAPQRAAAP